MKNLYPLLLAFAIAPAVQVVAAPEPAAEPVQSFDPAAVALLDESAKAYAALDGLKMNYVTYDQKSAKRSGLRGVISIEGQSKGKVTIQAPDDSVFNMTDGEKFYTQIDATTVQGNPIKSEVARDTVLNRIPSAASVAVPVLVSGHSPLTLDFMKWQSAQLLPDNGVRLVGLPGGPKLTYSLYFDPTDKLLRRVEFASEAKGVKLINLTIFSGVEINPDFAPDAFSFTPGNGIKEVADIAAFDPRIKVGATPFNLVGKDLNGHTHPWKKYAGKVVLVDFWATWCGPCVGELPNIQSKYKAYHSKGFELIGITLDDDKKTLTDFIKARNINFPQIYDGRGWKNVDSMTYGVRGVPLEILVGKDGKIAAVNPTGKLLEPAIKKALAKKYKT